MAEEDFGAFLVEHEVRITSLESLALATLAVLANRDPDLVRDILNAVPRPIPPGAASSVEDAEREPVADNLDRLLGALRDELGVDQRYQSSN